MKKLAILISAAAIVCSCSNDTNDAASVRGTSPTVKNTVNAPAGLADFKLSTTDQSINEGSYMEITNLSKNAKTYFWEFGDGQTSTEKVPHHLYGMCGMYELKLTVTDAAGNQSSFQRSVPVNCTVLSHHSNSGSSTNN